MLVYRLCKVGEVEKLLNNKDVNEIAIPGSNLIKKQQEKNINSHCYNFQLSYLHFFKKLESIFYFYTADKYICTYDIPDEILEKYEGEGFYLDYINFEKTQKTVEYAIPSNELDFSYLVKIDKINEVIDYEDYIFDPSLKDEIETIYLKEKGRSRSRHIS